MSAIILSAISLAAFIGGIIIFLNNQSIHQTLGTYGDFVGGTSGTLIAFATFLFLYLTFKEQRESVIKQRDDESVSRHLELLQSRVLSSSIDENRRTYVGYNALYKLSSELLDSITTQSADFGRTVLFKHPQLIDTLFLSDMQHKLKHYDLLFGSNIKSDFVTEFNSRKQGFDQNEYFKFVFHPWEPEPNDGNYVLSRFGGRMFYRTPFATRQYCYNNAFNVVRSKFPGFIEMYIHGVEMLRSQVMATSNPESYFATVRNSITLHEEVILFYYIASKQCSPEFASFAKRIRLFRTLKHRSSLLFDNPSDDQITQELLSSMNQW